MRKLICNNQPRRNLLRQNKLLNGIDYIEVGHPETKPDAKPSLKNQTYLRVVFLGKLNVDLQPHNIKIEGGRRISNLRIIEIKIHKFRSPDLDDFLLLKVDRAGDFSTYTLRVIEQDEAGIWQAHCAFDPRYDRATFSFKVDCPSDLDCNPQTACEIEPKRQPDINYLAKDYASFRQLILDRLSVVMPQWQERHVPDIGIALTEVLAYIGDHLSYYQDAVATEAYLATARQRISVRRHARLVDYTLHEGCNARAWVCIQTDTDLKDIAPESFYCIAGANELLMNLGNLVSEVELNSVIAAHYQVFEPLTNDRVNFYRSQNRMVLYTWGDSECCLTKGSTQATLYGKLSVPAEEEKESCNSDQPDNDIQQGPEDTPASVEQYPPLIKNQQTQNSSSQITAPILHLKVGDVVVFEEVLGPITGHQGDADPNHRHAVRLTSVEAGVDPLNNTPVVHITWAEQDRLPFAVCISAIGPAPECKLLTNITVVYGNVLLVDHGATTLEALGKVPTTHAELCCQSQGLRGKQRVQAAIFKPHLTKVPLTHGQALTPELVPAVQTSKQDVRLSKPKIKLFSSSENKIEQVWLPQQDLLASGPEDTHFVAELDQNGRAHLRFGNDEAGEQPDAELNFNATYRVGNGVAGNVGPGSISRMVFREGAPDGVNVRLHNPLPATGGTNPEPIAEAKQFAPYQFGTQLQRAITADDYARIAEREFPEHIQKAAARFFWTGSYYEVQLAIDPLGSDLANPDLIAAVEECLHKYRRIGHCLTVKPAQHVPLDLTLQVCIKPQFLRGHIRAALLSAFSNRRLNDGSFGYFHMDQLTFGDDIYLSHIVAKAQAIEGIQSVRVTKLQRLFMPSNQELENGVLPLSAFEIARLDNDPSLPENGRLQLDLRGGR